MASLRDIRNRINSVKSTQQVTRAMKMVAAAKLRRAQERIFQTRPYAFELAEVISHLQGHIDPGLHPLFQARQERQAALLVVVTADRGLAGAFNANIIKLAEQTIAQVYETLARKGQLYLYCIGRKGYDYFRRRNYPIAGHQQGIFDRLTFNMARQIADTLASGYLEGQWDEVRIVYNEFRNTIAQNRIVEPFLPIPTERFLTPIMERDLGQRPHLRPGYQVDYLFEPNPQAILEALVPHYLSYQIWRILLESYAAEQGARMVAMDNATTNAEELLRQLRLKYNRARQDAITKEILEITSGAEALAKGGA
ncbi:ATP synthase F1 subunit gamma [Rhodothermus bifroesti]|jgi:F-type H+-transporting ATPase subunit gamma|uniref:ATP synthase gamma chain n=1 Tax=Rhodothermus marinus TaxID=29549 RepID=A0A7V2F6N4_RHOMR|nr:ATP synthase F1 subunit gamma [Rhodothermus bifroesti]GBD00317.1 ATP synthase gamma chain [bacterium HR18]